MAGIGKDVSKDHNVVRMRRHAQPGIAFFLTLLILLYLIVLGVNFLTKSHVSIYEVNTSEISDDSPLYAYVLRKEEVVTTDDAGYINYFIPEGTRVAKGNVIYTIDDDDSLRDKLITLRNASATTTQIAPIREQIETYYNSFSMSDYTQNSDFHFGINNTILEHSRANLYRDFKKEIDADDALSSYRKYKATKTGVISYYTDGYESLKKTDITPEILDRYGSVERKQVAVDDKVAIGDAAYKLVTSNDWQLVAELDDSYYESLQDMDTIRVTVVKDDISFNASIEHLEKDGRHLVILSTSRYMERYINDRFLMIEFGIRHASGLKVPNSSIMEKEYYEVPTDFVTNNNSKYTVIKQVTDKDGNTDVENIDLTSYYIEDDIGYVRDGRLSKGDIIMSGDGSLFTLNESTIRTGVYSVNEGFCRFKPIDILYQNKEYTIVSDTTRDGLSPFDHIVVDPSELSDDDFID